MPFYAIILLLAITVTIIPSIQSHREHKVHNIVLYPDKHSWCKTLSIKQVISYPGCKSEEIDNNVCVGACFSYSIPHTYPSDPGEVCFFFLLLQYNSYKIIFLFFYFLGHCTIL